MMFDPAGLIVDSIDLECPARAETIARKAIQYSLPHLAQFFNDVSARQSGEDDAYGRRYQREVIFRKHLRVVSPVSGAPAYSTQSIAVRGCVFYRFRDQIDYYVASSKIRLGYPLAALFLPQSNCLLKWERGRGIQLSHLKSLTSLLQKKSSEASPVARMPTPVIVMGHRNFAHHLWNELSALECFLAAGLPNPPPELLLTREPLGPVDSIFPELSTWRVVRLGGKSPLSAAQSGKLFVNLAGFRIPCALRKRIAHYASSVTTPKTSDLIQAVRELNGPVFWLSVRLQTPTLIDQQQIVATIARDLVRTYSRCCVLLDGFSLPADWLETNDETVAFYRSAANSTRETIDEIIQDVREQCTPTALQKIVNIGGLGILDSIALAQLADVYCCHAGTVQHKVGWTTNTPGIIHGSRKVLSGDPSTWHANRLEGGVRPLALAPGMVEDIRSARTEKNPRETDYRILDSRAFIRLVLDYFGAQLTSKLS